MNIINNYTIEYIGYETKYGVYGPATIYLKNGFIHRDNDLPAVVYKDDRRNDWYKDGKKHREGDLPAIIFDDGYKEWWKHGVKYR